MTQFERLKQEIEELYSLAMVQQSARLGLRAFWLGLAGLLVSWGVNTLWGWLPNPFTWVLVAFGFILFPLARILVSLTSFFPDQDWVWKLDRNMGLREQLSTAWEVAQNQPRGMLSSLLVRDTLERIPQARKIVLKEGWFRRSDIIAALILAPLVVLMLLSFLNRQAPIGTSSPPAVVPPITVPQEAAEPEPDQPQPAQNGAPGDQEQAEDGDGQSGDNPPGEGDRAGQGQPGASPEQMSGSLRETLRELGAGLSRQAGTYELGQALENLDLAEAADILDQLQLDDLSPESRDNLEQALREAAEAAEQAGDNELAQNLLDAADSLAQDSQQEGEALGKLAENLRQLAGGEESGQMSGSGGGAGSGSGAETGLPEPLPRLRGESGDFSLSIDDLSDPSLLSPASPGEVGDGTARGSLDAPGRSDAGASQSPLLPTSYQWKWREVVEEYFRR